MKKIALILLLSVNFFQSPSVRAGGDIVGNAGGLAEQNFSYAWFMLPHLVQMCEHLPGCYNPQQDAAAMAQIKTQLKKLEHSQLKYLSESAQPGTFGPNATVVMRQEGNQTQILVNLDKLYLPTRPGELPRAMASHEAILILVDLLLIPTDVISMPDEIEVILSDRLGELLKSSLESIDMSAWKHSQMRLLILNHKISGAHLVSDSSERISALPPVTNLCQTWNANWTTKEGTTFSGIYWKGAPLWNEAQKRSDMKLSATATALCLDEQQQTIQIQGEAKLALSVQALNAEGQAIDDPTQGWTRSADIATEFVKSAFKWTLQDLRQTAKQ